jgi:RNA polymerase sigma-70 factor (ECF subfamily)
MSTFDIEEAIGQAWVDHRAHLVGVAYRMLGDLGEAEEAVQEAYARLARADVEAIEDLRGWLTVVTRRLCLDRLRSARARREVPTTDEPDARRSLPFVAPPDDPADRVTLDDSVRLALLVVLERLTPAERVVFVLHDIFQLPFPAVADTVGRTPAACRQLARRARTKIDETALERRLPVTPAESALVTSRFIDACTNGDLRALLAVLDPDVSGVVDLLAHRVTTGADEVAANLLRFWRGATFVAQPVTPVPAVLIFLNRRLAGVAVLGIEGDRVVDIHITVQPAKLEELARLLAVRPEQPA